MFAVTVTFTVTPHRRDAFMRAMLDNAATSKRLEPGCRQFDVCTDTDRPDEVFLYELYDDGAAFDRHLASDHFVAFAAHVENMVVDKTVRTYGRVA